MYAYCNNNPIMYADPSGYGFFIDTFEKIEKFVSDTFGMAVYESTEIEKYEVDNIFFSVGAGAYVTTKISGNDEKPIVIYCQNASEWWKIWEYRVGMQANFGDDKGINVSTGPGGIGGAFAANGSSFELQVGEEFSVTTSKSTDFVHHSADVSTSITIKPAGTLVGRGIVGVFYVAPQLALPLIPVFVPLLN